MSSSDDYASTSDDGGGGVDALFGSLKTQLRYEPAGGLGAGACGGGGNGGGAGALRLNVRQLLETGRGVEVKYKGTLHTGTGEYRYRAQLRKPFFTNTPLFARIAAAERGVELREGREGGGPEGGLPDARKLLPGGAKGLLWRDYSIAPGVAVSSDPDGRFAYTLGIRKQPQIVKRTGTWDSWLSWKGTLEFNPNTQQVGAFGNARLKLFRFGLTSTQDVRVSIGYDWRVAPGEASPLDSTDDGGSGGGLSFSKVPYLKLAENDWAVRWQGSTLSFTYQI